MSKTVKIVKIVKIVNTDPSSKEARSNCGFVGKYAKSTKNNLYQVWYSMMKRCYSKKDKDFPYIGGRGIRVHRVWHCFKTFVDDMGERPEGLVLVRIDDTKDYGPTNCKWGERSEVKRHSRSEWDKVYNSIGIKEDGREAVKEVVKDQTMKEGFKFRIKIVTYNEVDYDIKELMKLLGMTYAEIHSHLLKS